MRDTLGFPMPGFLAKVYFKIPEVGEVNAASFLLGMFVSAVILALLSYPLVHLFSAIMPHYLPVRKVRELHEAKEEV